MIQLCLTRNLKGFRAHMALNPSFGHWEGDRPQDAIQSFIVWYIETYGVYPNSYQWK